MDEQKPVILEIGAGPENWLLGTKNTAPPIALPEFITIESLPELEQIGDRLNRDIDAQTEQ